MPIRYSLHETPSPEGREDGEGKELHARALSYDTIRMDEICEIITERSSLSSADVKAVLDSFAWLLRTRLPQGYRVELEELGFFSPSLKTVRKDNGKIRVTMDGINFRCSKWLKASFRNVRFTKAKGNARGQDGETRRRLLLDYLDENPYISKRTYAAIAGCSRYRADLDMRAYEAEGLVCRKGYANQGIYMLAGGENGK